MDPKEHIGPATFFVSHAWSYKFGKLVEMIATHREGLEPNASAAGANLGFSSAAGEGISVVENNSKGHPSKLGHQKHQHHEPLYWLDIFAVSQNFTGDFSQNPDSDFPGM